jgi:hypothetical protein
LRGGPQVGLPVAVRAVEVGTYARLKKVLKADIDEGGVGVALPDHLPPLRLTLMASFSRRLGIGIPVPRRGDGRRSFQLRRARGTGAGLDAPDRGPSMASLPNYRLRTVIQWRCGGHFRGTRAQPVARE